MALEVTVFDERFGAGSVRDRYLFYVAPLVLLGFLCALVDGRWPRWSLVLPTLLVVLGFALDHLPVYGVFHADSPVAVLHDWLLRCDAVAERRARRSSPAPRSSPSRSSRR